MTKTTAVILACALAGCASQPTSDADVQPPLRVHAADLAVVQPEKAALRFKRDGGVANGSLCTHYVFLDGRPLADLAPNQGFTAYIPPGQHIVGLRMGGGLCTSATPELAVDVLPNARVTIRTGVEATGAHFIQRSAM